MTPIIKFQRKSIQNLKVLDREVPTPDLLHYILWKIQDLSKCLKFLCFIRILKVLSRKSLVTQHQTTSCLHNL